MKQIGSGILKRGLFIKFLFLFLVSAFSIDGFACKGVTGTVSAPSNPNDPVSNYTAGFIMYCSGEERGLSYIERASDMNHVAASYFLGGYYRRDQGQSVSLPTTQENYDAAVFYYERTAKLIEDTSHYPSGAHRDVSKIEGRNYMSIRTFLHLTSLYFDGYSFALGEMLENDVSYTDTIQVLEKMKSAADRCLNRPSLSVWGARQEEVTDSKQVICQAKKDFAVKILGTEDAPGLEYQRIEIAKHCDVALKECTAHKAIFQEIVQAAQKMHNKTDTVSKI